MTPIAVLIATGLIAAGIKLMDTIKAATNGDSNTLITQLGIWLIGIGLVFLMAAASLTSDFEIIVGHPLGGLDVASKIIIGILLISNGSVLFDFKKAFDRTDSAKQPALLPSKNLPSLPTGIEVAMVEPVAPNPAAVAAAADQV